MRALSMLLLLVLTPMCLVAQSAGRRAYLSLVTEVVDHLAPSFPRGTGRPDRPLLVDVESFAYLGRFAAGEPIEQSAIAAAIGRPFINMREGTATQCQEPCGTWRDGTFIQLNGALRMGPILELTVTKMSTQSRGVRGKTIDTHSMRLLYTWEGDRWRLMEEKTLSVT